MGVGLKGGGVREGEVWPRVAVRYSDGGGVKSRKTDDVHVCSFFFALHVTSMYFKSHLVS